MKDQPTALLAVALNVPGWCPKHVADKARKLYRQRSKRELDTALIQRMVSDPRMKGVWAELKKRRRQDYKSTSTPYHEINLPEQVRSKSASHDEGVAAAGLFEHIFNNASANLQLRPSDTTSPYQEMAERLRTKAEHLRNHMSPRRSGARMAEQLEKAAKVYDRIRPKGQEGWVEGIAFSISLYLKVVYGAAMYKMTAIMTTVIAEQEITAQMVRGWWNLKNSKRLGKNRRSSPPAILDYP